MPPSLSIWGSDLQGPPWVLDEKNQKVVPGMRGGRMEPGGCPTGHRGRDPGQGWNLGLAPDSHIKVSPRPPAYTFVWWII